MIQTQIAIFASGAGSNALKIIEHFKGNDEIKVMLIVSNKPNAGVLAHANTYGIRSMVINRTDFNGPASILPALEQAGINFIVLAGFLWKVPDVLISAYKGKILNIHPALLPNYGGQGMYGDKVHAAVLAAGETESGLTIHLADEQYDHGKIIFQAKCAVEPGDTVESLANKIHALEHQHFAPVIKAYLKNVYQKDGATDILQR